MTADPIAPPDPWVVTTSASPGVVVMTTGVAGWESFGDGATCVVPSAAVADAVIGVLGTLGYNARRRPLLGPDAEDALRTLAEIGAVRREIRTLQKRLAQLRTEHGEDALIRRAHEGGASGPVIAEAAGYTRARVSQVLADDGA